MPDGYGIPPTADGLLGWDDVEQRLVAAKHYWLATRPARTARRTPCPAGACGSTDASTTTARPRRGTSATWTKNPAVTLTLESGTEVVIVEGESTATSADPAGLGVQLAAAFEKYAPEYTPGADSWADGGGLRVITPRRALAWFAFPADCTRFTF